MSESKVLKGMRVSILRNAEFDCTNGGISSTHTCLTLVGEGVPQIFEVGENEPYLELGTIIFRGETSYHAKSMNDGKENKHHMFGGNFCYSSDSRFSEIGFSGGLKIHDRVEGI